MLYAHNFETNALNNGKLPKMLTTLQQTGLGSGVEGLGSRGPIFCFVFKVFEVFGTEDTLQAGKLTEASKQQTRHDSMQY